MRCRLQKLSPGRIQSGAHYGNTPYYMHRIITDSVIILCIIKQSTDQADCSRLYTHRPTTWHFHADSDSMQVVTVAAAAHTALGRPIISFTCQQQAVHMRADD